MTRRILLALHLVGLASFLLALSALGRIYLETQTPFWIMRSAKAHVPDGLGQGAAGLHLPVLFRDWSRIDRTGEALLISEVMYDPLGAEPGSEWIELFNPSSQVVELTHVKVGDEETADGGEGMLRFPPGRSLPPGQVLVIANKATHFFDQHGFQPDFEMRESDPLVPTLVRYASWASGNVLLLNSSDEVLVLGDQDQVIDAVSWGESTFAFDPPAPDVPAGHSLERQPAHLDSDTALDWLDQPVPAPGQVSTLVPSSTPTSATGTPSVSPSPGVPTPTPTPPPATLTATTAASPPHTPTPAGSAVPTQTPSATGTLTPTPQVSSTPMPTWTPGPGIVLLVGEVFYDTPGTDTQEEWIEVYNAGTAPVDLSLYKIGDEEAQGGSEGMFQFPAGASISPGGRIVVALQAAGFAALYGQSPDFEVQDSDPNVPNMVAYAVWGSGTIAMSNNGDEVLLLDGQDQPVDVVVYESGSYPGVIGHGGVPTGHSLERWPPDQDTDDCSQDFIDQAVPNPGI